MWTVSLINSSNKYLKKNFKGHIVVFVVFGFEALRCFWPFVCHDFGADIYVCGLTAEHSARVQRQGSLALRSLTPEKLFVLSDAFVSHVLRGNAA